MAGNMQQANRKYYSSKGKGIYSDFSTFAQGKTLATCNAIEFAGDFSGAKGQLDIVEYGVGNGNFAKVFLDEVKKANPALYAKISYHLFDLSPKMLSDAKKNLSKHSAACSFHLFDAASDIPRQPFDYCRINELLSDLPAELFSMQNGKVSPPTTNPFVTHFLSRIDSGRKIPFNFAAERFISHLLTCGKPNFRLDLFDYGFYSQEDVSLLPVEEWNRTILREYGTQITVDLNFLLLSASAASQGFQSNVEGQKEYAEQVLGCKLALKQTDEGLDYAKSKQDSITEDDGFYHMRIGR